MIMRRPTGFTLIELMVVIAIIGILATILLPNFMRTRYQATLAACEQNERELATSLMMYSEDNGGDFPSQSLGLNTVVPIYSAQVPKCPVTNTAYDYKVTSDFQNYTLYCTGEHIELLGASGGPAGSDHFPEYSALSGILLK